MNRDYTIAVLGSHSALDVCRGAKDLGFKTLVICEKGREETYKTHFATRDNLGCVDEVIIVKKFSHMMNEDIQSELLKRNAIFIPHRSFEVYIDDYHKIEKHFKVPMFGNRFLLKSEERGVRPNQYDLLDEAKIKYPKQFKNPKEIDRLCIVKVLAKRVHFERAFFFVSSYKEFIENKRMMIKGNRSTRKAFKNVVIEEFVVGVQVNFNFFYDPINKKLELIGTDTRRQTNIEGYSKVPPPEYSKVITHYGVSHNEAGHIAVTVLESLLEDAFKIGNRFIKAAKKLYRPGVIGPFGLQTMIIPKPHGKEIIVFDVSPRMPGSPGIFATPYSGYLYGQNVSMGKRVAMEIKEAIQKGELDKILTWNMHF